MSDNDYIGSDIPFFMKNDNDTFTVGNIIYQKCQTI